MIWKKPKMPNDVQQFLVVYEDVWRNKYIYYAQIGNLGDIVKSALDNIIGGEIIYEFDVKKLNSEDPYQAHGLGEGFYDIDIMNNGEYERIMIFILQV